MKNIKGQCDEIDATSATNVIAVFFQGDDIITKLKALLANT